MPIYEYKCLKNNHHFEAMQKISDPPLTVCTQCDGEVVKLMSNTSFQLKGTGWYSTDYKRSSKPATSTTSSSASTTESTSKSEKSDAGCGSGCGCHSGSSSKKTDTK